VIHRPWGTWQRLCPTISFGGQIRDDISNSNVDDTEEALVLLFELLLIKYLNGEDASFIGLAIE
jgi:hypothetical protein